jgi:UDP-N-acetylmuramate--alanine ligase
MRPVFPKRVTRVHFVGLGGIGMSGIAEVLLNLGYQVSGSDLRGGPNLDRLAGLGASVFVGHAADQVVGAHVVVVSSAVRPGNPEVDEARRRSIPVIPRAEMLAELMRLKFGIAVSGSHGKTSTTSLLATILAQAGLDPTVVIGGKLNSIGSNARLGQGPYMVVEADESDGSFLRLSPTIAVVTNIDPEHLDHFGTLEALQEAFLAFVNQTPFYGLVVVCLDHPHVQEIIPRIHKRFVTYGLSAQADYACRDITHHGLSTEFEVVIRGTSMGRVSLRMPGEHYVLNALSTIAVADELDIPFAVTARALTTFEGVQRRFTVRGEARGALVVDDYAHHPAEIASTLAGARTAFPDRRLVAVFQPHRYTRLRDLLEAFARAFNHADQVLVCDVYAAGEDPIDGVSGERVAAEIRAHGHKAVQHVGGLDRAGAVLAELAQPQDLIITLGAGDVWKVGTGLLQARSDAPEADHAR